MPVNSVMPPYEMFLDGAGKPLDGGFIYIGLPGLEARSNPKAAFFDPDFTIPCGPSIRTKAGYPVRNGTPATIYVDGNHSITITDRNDVFVFGNLSRTFELGTPTTDLAQIVAPDGNLIQTGFGFASDTNTGLIRAASDNLQLVAGGVPGLQVIPSVVSMLRPLQLTQGLDVPLAVASGGTGATTAANARTALGVPAVPTGSVGVGQWVTIAPAFGAAYSVPAGGEWAFVAFIINVNGQMVDAQVFTGVVAGGSAIWVASPGNRIVGFAYRFR